MKIKKTLLNFGAYLFALLILLFIFAFMMKPEKFSVLLDFSPFEIVVTLFLSLGAYIGNGAEYYVMARKLKITMEKKDILLLPLAMNLAGTILPFQGAMTYQIFLMKKKYNSEISQGCSIAAFLYLITVTISGLAGVAIFCLRKTESILFLIISLLFLSAPFFLFLFVKIVTRIRISGKIGSIINFARKILEGMALLGKDLKLTTILLIIYLLRLLSMVILFYWIAKCLNINVYFIAILLLNLWNMISLLLKFTPNNLGVSQVVSGVMFALINLPESDGVLLSFVSTASFLIMAFSAGVVAMLYHFWQITMSKTKK